MSRKPSSSIYNSTVEKSVGASTQSCLTPFVTLNDLETSPPTPTFATIPICRASIIVVNFSGHPYFHSSCYCSVIPNVLNVLLNSTNVMYIGRSCSMHFPCSCRRQHFTFTVLRLRLNPHSVFGTTSGVIWVGYLLRKILPAMERREIPLLFRQSVRSPLL